jgi:hypothetical protein
MMPGAQKPPVGPPPSSGVLGRYVRAYARELAVSEARVRAWVSYMVLAGVLERSKSSEGHRFTARPGKKNERFKDPFDLLLMESLVSDYTDLRAACESVFQTRDTHTWPPALQVPPHWLEPFAALAAELDLPMLDAHEAMERVSKFVERIRAA